MKVACLGDEPTGLYFAISAKLQDAYRAVNVFERIDPAKGRSPSRVFSRGTLNG